MEKKHTPEPWSWGFEDKSVIYIQGPGEHEDHVLWSEICPACQRSGSRCTAPSDANAERIIDCVNALAGVDDPAAFVEAVGALLDVWRMPGDNVPVEIDDAMNKLWIERDPVSYAETVKSLRGES